MTEICSICLEPMTDYFTIHTTECDHNFHGNCINRWLEGNNQCPLCRGVIGEDVENDEEYDEVEQHYTEPEVNGEVNESLSRNQFNMEVGNINIHNHNDNDMKWWALCVVIVGLVLFSK